MAKRGGQTVGTIAAIATLAIAVLLFAGYLYPRLRLVEDELPDAIGGDKATSGA